MKTIPFGILTVVVTLSSVSQAGSAEKRSPTPAADRERLIGAWHLTSIVGPDGKPVTTGQPLGMLVYTRDGHVSVQLMYPKSTNAQSNQYVLDGYEASFGSYDLNEATHTVTHHVQGSNTRDLLVGKDLPRVYQFSTDGHLIIKSARPDEHWSARWEHY
jgi:hypothetical protein